MQQENGNTSRRDGKRPNRNFCANNHEIALWPQSKNIVKVLESQTAPPPLFHNPPLSRLPVSYPLTAVCQAFCWNFCKYNWIFVRRNHFNAFDFNFRISNFSFPLLHLHCLLLLLPCLLCMPHCLSLAVTFSSPSPRPVRCDHLCATVVTHFESTANQYLFISSCKQKNWNKSLILWNIHPYKQTHW